MNPVKIDFDDEEFFEFSEVLTPSAIERALKRAVRKTSMWVRTHLLREVKDIGVKRKVIVHRVRLYNKAWRESGDGGKAVKVWFGIDPLKADKIARPIRMSKGYRVKKWKFPTAFMPSKNSKYSGKLYQRTTKKRLPIMRSKVEIDEAANKAMEKIEPLIPARMRELAIRELRYEMHKEQGTL
ncbi:hypothetical protein [Prosthecochloris sp.]|uniref:hypothetical protein n=1 Tax=Prosthecochloris sp. TaxID=290513 RepID=UPI0025E20B9B|nr:hypothetical protein [Prosthecochloris sp.]